MTGGAGGERTRKIMPMHNLPITGDGLALYLSAVAADLDALASRLAKIEAMPDIAQRLEQGNRLNEAGSAGVAIPSECPAPSDEEIADTIVHVLDKRGVWASANDARAVLAALRARGGTIR